MVSSQKRLAFGVSKGALVSVACVASGCVTLQTNLLPRIDDCPPLAAEPKNIDGFNIGFDRVLDMGDAQFAGFEATVQTLQADADSDVGTATFDAKFWKHSNFGPPFQALLAVGAGLTACTLPFLGYTDYYLEAVVNRDGRRWREYAYEDRTLTWCWWPLLLGRRAAVGDQAALEEKAAEEAVVKNLVCLFSRDLRLDLKNPSLSSAVVSEQED